MKTVHSITRQAPLRLPRVPSIALALVLALTANVSAAKNPNTINVSDVERLYEAVNNPSYAGKTIALASGTYVLTARNPANVPRLNGGRLELQPGMSLSGKSGHPEDVVIDASGPQGPSFVGQLGVGLQGATGVIRIGRSRETIEWLTVRGAATAAACIETDLVGDPTVSLRIAHTILEGSIRGLDVRNFGSPNRTINIDLDDNELRGNTANAGQGIRFVNTNGADGAVISASLHGNRSHGNLTGCLAANLASNGASIDIDSHNDSFDTNVVGCIIFGGISTSPTATANDNTITFDAHAGEISQNVGVLAPDGDIGGLVVVGGQSTVAGATSRNVVHVSFHGSKFNDNQDNIAVSAWGARTAAAAPAGTGNAVAIELHGSSKKALTRVVQSTPDELVDTNSAVIVK